MGKGLGMQSRTLSRVARVAAVVGFTLAVLAPAAAAQTDYPTPTTTPTTPPTSNVSGVVVSSGQSQGSGFLAFTGGNIAMLVVIGLGAAGAGIVLVRYGRRRRAGVTAS